LEAIRNLKSSGKSFDEYDIELEIESVKASYLRESERKRAIESDRESSERLRLEAKATATASRVAELQKANKRKIIIVLVIIVVTLLALTIILYATGCFDSLSQEPESWERYL
jgi:hypothetical protein